MNKKIAITFTVILLGILVVLLVINKINVSDKLDEYKTNAYINDGPLSSFNELHNSYTETEEEITGNKLVDGTIMDLCTKNDFKSFVIDGSWVDANFGCTYYHIIFDDSVLYVLCYDANAKAVGVSLGDYDDYKETKY